MSAVNLTWHIKEQLAINILGCYKNDILIDKNVSWIEWREWREHESRRLNCACKCMSQCMCQAFGRFVSTNVSCETRNVLLHTHAWYTWNIFTCHFITLQHLDTQSQFNLTLIHVLPQLVRYVLDMYRYLAVTKYY